MGQSLCLLHLCVGPGGSLASGAQVSTSRSQVDKLMDRFSDGIGLTYDLCALVSDMLGIEKTADHPA